MSADKMGDKVNILRESHLNRARNDTAVYSNILEKHTLLVNDEPHTQIKYVNISYR